MNALYVVEDDGEFQIHQLNRPHAESARIIAADLNEEEADTLVSASRGSNDKAPRVYRALMNEVTNRIDSPNTEMASLFARIATVVGKHESPEDALATFGVILRGAEETLHRGRHARIAVDI